MKSSTLPHGQMKYRHLQLKVTSFPAIILSKSPIVFGWVFICLLTHSLYAQKNNKNTNPSKSIGITDVVDVETNINYNQLFKSILSENEIKINNAEAPVQLIEHYSQASASIGVKFLNDKMVVSLYTQEKLARRDTLYVNTLINKRGISVTPFTIIKNSNGFELTRVRQQTKEYLNGLKNGLLLREVNGIDISQYEQEKINALFFKSRKGVSSIKVYDPVAKMYNAFLVHLYPDSLAEWSRPISFANLGIIFSEVLNYIADNGKDIGLSLKKAKKYSYSTLENLYSNYKVNLDDKCMSYEQMALCKNTSMHYIESGYVIDSLFEKEIFYQPKKSGNSEVPGNAALNVLKYYYFDQKPSYLSINENIDDKVKRAVQELSGPFYNKPGVVVNYYLAGLEYEEAGDYRAALNQYYASLHKVDDMISSDLSKVRVRRVLLDHISICCKQLNQLEYSKIMDLADDCLESIMNNAGLISKDSNFYNFSEQVLKLSSDVEEQLKQQRSDKGFAIFDAITSIGMGLMTLDFDLGLSTSFLFSAVETLSDNSLHNFEINSMLRSGTEALSVNIPKELLSEEKNPNEILATTYINFALENSSPTEKLIILNLIREYAKHDPQLSEIVDQSNLEFKLNNDKFDTRNIVKLLLQNEITVYRYEKKGNKVPGKT